MPNKLILSSREKIYLKKRVYWDIVKRGTEENLKYVRRLCVV